MGNMAEEEALVRDVPVRTLIQSVSRAMRIVMAVASSDEGLTVKAVADQFNLSTPTAYHLLNTLVHERVLFKDESRRYLLGHGASVISDAYSRKNLLPDRYLKVLNSLAAETGETAYLSAWRSGTISVLATVEGSKAVRVAGLTVGYSDNIHARASGKLLLTFASDELRESVLGRAVFRKLTPNTIVSRPALRREFEQIRETDVAYDREEFHEGVECASSPIRENGVVVACFTLACPVERFSAAHDTIISALKKASGEASQG